MKENIPTHKMTYQVMQQSDVPRSRNGKHRKIVSSILEDVASLAPGTAVKIPISALDDTKQNVRSALSRESKKRKIGIATAADSHFLYVWAVDVK